MKPAPQVNLEGVTLEAIVTQLAGSIGWPAMAAAIPVRCFTHDPSIKSSLKFLRRTPWARARVEQLFLRHAQSTAVDQVSPRPTHFGTAGGV